MAITAISRDWGVDPSIVRVITTDNLAAITTANYLTVQASNIATLNNGAFEWATSDQVLISYNGGEGFFTRNAGTATFVATPAAPGNLADTLTSAHVFVGNAGNVATDVAMTGDIAITNAGVTAIQANVVDSTKLALNTIQYAQIAMTAAEWNGMYGAPKLLIAAPGAGNLIVVDACVLKMTFVAAQYAAGGAVALQYDNTVHGAGTLASATLAAATVNGYAASSNVSVAPLVTSSAITTTENKGLYISNQTGAFTTGDGTWHVSLAYRIIAA
jgi:hypothetical protein